MASHDDTQARTMRFDHAENILLLTAKHKLEMERLRSVSYSELMVELARRYTAGEG